MPTRIASASGWLRKTLRRGASDPISRRSDYLSLCVLDALLIDDFSSLLRPFVGAAANGAPFWWYLSQAWLTWCGLTLIALLSVVAMRRRVLHFGWSPNWAWLVFGVTFVPAAALALTGHGSFVARLAVFLLPQAPLLLLKAPRSDRPAESGASAS